MTWNEPEQAALEQLLDRRERGAINLEEAFLIRVRTPSQLIAELDLAAAAS